MTQRKPLTPKLPRGADPKEYIAGSTFKRPKEIKLKRSPMPRTTTDKAKAKEQSKLERLRSKYKKSFPHCVLCHRPVWDCHEMVWGKWRHVTVKLIQFWLPLCRHHHEEMHLTSLWPVARQLAVKCKCDYKNFDLLFVNETLVGELDIPMSDVDFYLNELTG